MTTYYFRRPIRRLPGLVIKAVPIPKPAVTQGFGARVRTGPVCKDLALRSVLLVTDRTIYGLGLHEKVVKSLESSGVRCAVFCDIDSEPTVDIIRAGLRAAVACKAEGIVALGGGSVLDSCKIIAAGLKTPKRDVTRYLWKLAPVPGKTVPMISIPTTAGTGAEHTVGAVVKNARGVKQATVLIGLDVRHVILDGELMINAPQAVTVWCGIDALSHGLEGLLTVTKSCPADVRKSRECVRLVLENLPRLLDDPKDRQARQRMCLAAFYGGNAINRQLAGYVHACAHSIGALYHIPHGKAIAFCLMPVLLAQREICRRQLADLSVWCGLAEGTDDEAAAVDRLLERLRELLDRCGLEHGCSELRQEDYPKLIRMINTDAINYSPSKIFRDSEVRALLDRIRKGV